MESRTAPVYGFESGNVGLVVGRQPDVVGIGPVADGVLADRGEALVGIDDLNIVRQIPVYDEHPVLAVVVGADGIRAHRRDAHLRVARRFDFNGGVVRRGPEVGGQYERVVLVRTLPPHLRPHTRRRCERNQERKPHRSAPQSNPSPADHPVPSFPQKKPVKETCHRSKTAVA
jgi:hypothetical protein